MRTVLICHQGSKLDEVILARWLASFSELAGIVVIEEEGQRIWKRVKREISRVGALRFLDVLAFRVFYKLALAKRDESWREQTYHELSRRFPELPATVRRLHTPSPNSREARAFIKELKPDIMLARCKTLLKESVFTIPTSGTYVLHPGICPEYRNSHGCFWALARGDTKNVGMTLLRIDRGVDTGPIYGYFSYPFDERRESHVVIQYRVVYDNLDAIAARLREIAAGAADPIDVSGRPSAMWGQPQLLQYARWKLRARKDGR